MTVRVPGLCAVALLATAPAAFAANKPGGAQLFMNHCAACHGADGEGGGPAASAMQTTVPNLRTLAELVHAVDKVITEGIESP
jgi:mono/diheme cytochrome c family protein